jgi:hypothetical protein
MSRCNKVVNGEQPCYTGGISVRLTNEGGGLSPGLMVTVPMNVCTSCGERTERQVCPECNQATTAEYLIPTHCLDCGKPLTLPPHLQTSLGQCEDCANENRTVIGLRAWDKLL